MGFVRLIALLKLTKAVILLVLGVATVVLLHRDVAEVLGKWTAQLHLDPDGRLAQLALEHGANLSPSRLRAVAGGMFVYAGLLSVEGVGLLLGKRWGELLTVIVTASLIPLELYELARHPTLTRGAVLFVNVVIVLYLTARLRRHL